MTDFEYMNECMVRDLVLMLMEDMHVLQSEAMDMVFTSDTYKNLLRPETGLYFQSPVYIYDYLKRELQRVL